MFIELFISYLRIKKIKNASIAEDGILDGVMPHVQKTKKVQTLREFILQE